MKPITSIPENYLDLIFINRNKNYGAYLLRKNYPTTLVKSVGFVFGGIMTVALYSFIHKTDAITITPPVSIIHTLTNIQPNIEIEKPVKQIIPATIKPTVSTNTVPHIVQNDEITSKPDEHISSSNSINTNGSSAATTNGTSGGTNTTIINSDASTTSNYTPIRWAEEMPKFQGVINDYLSNHIHYPEIAKSSNIQGKVVIEFIISEDGSVSNLRLVKGIGGGCDEEAMAVVRNMPKWTPGKQNGKPVKIYMLLPITFKLD